MELLRIAGLSADPLEAAAAFHAGWAGQVLAQAASGDVLMIFPPAEHAHRGWRLAAVQMLARRLAPVRINALASDSDAAIASTARYLARAPGLTGQLLVLDPEGAG